MDQKILIAALKVVCAEYDLDNIKGPKWVVPDKKEIYQEIINEEEAPDVPKRQLMKSLDNYTVETFKGNQIRTIGISDPHFKVPDDWLDPTKNIDMEYDWKYRYSHKHHKDLIPAMIDGGQVTMPVVVQNPDAQLFAVSGRHRINYAFQLGVPLKAVVLSKDFTELLYDVD